MAGLVEGGLTETEETKVMLIENIINTTLELNRKSNGNSFALIFLEDFQNPIILEEIVQRYKAMGINVEYKKNDDYPYDFVEVYS